MTDDKIIEGLTRWVKSFDGIATDLVWLAAALALINHQKAEIERLKDFNENLQTANTCLSNEILDIKSEARKEFAERLGELFEQHKTDAAIIWVSVVMNRLLKEMESESE